MKNQQFFIHLGLPKTGTTYLQENIFSKFDNNDISYLGKAKSVSIWDLMELSSNKYLISSEHLLANPFTCAKGKWFDEFKINLQKIHYKFPNAEYIISLRKHESLILSYYKEHISKGNRQEYPEIEDFYDISNDNGQASINDFYFKEIIEEIIKVTSQKPFVFFQEDLRKDTDRIISSLEKFLSIPKQHIEIFQGKRTNVGVKRRQAKWLIFFNKINKFTRSFGLSLYAPVLIRTGLNPDYIIRNKLAWIPDKPLRFSDETSKFISENYKLDFEWVQKYIENQRK